MSRFLPADCLYDTPAIMDDAININDCELWNNCDTDAKCINELFNIKYAQNRIYRQLMNRRVSLFILKKAHENNGISEKEYLSIKMEWLKILIKSIGLPKIEVRMIQWLIPKLILLELNSWIQLLSNVDDDKYVDNVMEARKYILHLSQTDIANTGIIFFDAPDSIENTLKTNRNKTKITALEVYQLEIKNIAPETDKYMNDEKNLISEIDNKTIEKILAK